MVNAFRWMVFVIGLAVVTGSIMVTSAGNPIIVINSPSDGDTVDTDKITVSGSAMGTDGAVVESVEVNGELADGTTSWRKDISLQPGLNGITVKAKDNMKQSSTKPITVTYIASTTTTISGGGYRNNNNNNGYINTPIPMPNGSISITTIPSGAAVYWDDSFAGNTSITLEDVVGHHKIRISKEGYYSKIMNIELKRDITKELNIELEQITGSIYISSTPSGACVYLDGDNRNANTPCMLSEVVGGNHTIKLTKPDYFDVERNVPVFDNNTTYLRENLTGCGYINISSNSPGANVYLDGNYTGETPMNISTVVVGDHTLKLTKFGYFDVIRLVAVFVGRTHQLHVNLTECGYINISSYPSGASVFVDGNYMGKTPPKNISTVARGNHTIKLTLSDYFDVIIKNVSVSVGETCHLRENLTGYGSLSISSNPSKAKVYLDGVYKGETPLPTSKVGKVVVGSHTINLTKFGYADVEKMIHVSAGELIEEDATLSIPPWVKLLVEGGIIAVIVALITKGVNPRRLKEKDLLFCLDPSYRQHLKEGDVDEKLTEVFKANSQSLPTEPKLSKIAEKRWKIEDGEMQYSIEDTEKRLNVYKKRNN